MWVYFSYEPMLGLVNSMYMICWSYEDFALVVKIETWWRDQMETFSVLVALCPGNSPVTGEFPAQRPATRCLDAFFDMRLNKRLSKQSLGWWPETPSRPLWRHCSGEKWQQDVNKGEMEWKLQQPRRNIEQNQYNFVVSNLLSDGLGVIGPTYKLLS